ncbi:MAG: hypothetical protein ACLSE6_02700 [Alphaproteobacteria bacterium]
MQLRDIVDLEMMYGDDAEAMVMISGRRLMIGKGMKKLPPKQP